MSKNIPPENDSMGLMRDDENDNQSSKDNTVGVMKETELKNTKSYPLQRRFLIPQEKLDKRDNELKIYFSNFILYVRALLVNILVFIAAIYIFTSPDQSKDLVNGIAIDGGWAIFWFWLGISLLGFSLWYTSIIALATYDLRELATISPPDPEKEDIHHKIIRVLPFIFGISIYVIICFAFNGQEIVRNPWGWIFLLAGLVLGYVLFRFRKSQMEKKNLKHLISKNPLDYEAFMQTVSRSDRIIIRVSWYLFATVLLLGLVLGFLNTKPTYIPQLFNSGAIISVYLVGVVILFNILWVRIKAEYIKISTGFLVLILIPVFTLLNNNHNLRLVEGQAENRKSIEEDFKGWLSERLDSAYTPENKMPIFFVAAEGGGIRSMKWTALMLDKFYWEGNPLFPKNLYAISGVSGGSVGSVFQQASLFEKKLPKTQKLLKAVQGDYLAPVTFGLLLPDMMQSILPFPIHAWDRSRWLEDAFHYSFEDEFGQAILDTSLNDYWQSKATQKNPYLSHIFLNCTALETGQKVLISDVAISPTYFGNTLDLLSEIHKEISPNAGIPLKTAASLSARFPLVTSAGKIDLGKRSLQIVDGGYHDNTGLETISQILSMILAETDIDTLKRLSFHVILLKNSLDKTYKEVDSKDFLVDVAAPLNTIISNWGNSTVTTIHNTHNHFSALSKLGLDIEFYPFQLDRKVIIDENNKRVYTEAQGKQIILPLGWYLSKRAGEEIDRQLHAVTSPKDTVGDKMAKHNFETFQRLMEKIE